MSSEQRLSDVLSEFARTMVTDFPIQAILDRLVERIVDILPVTAAGVRLISPGVHQRYVAASDEDALRFEQLQTDLGQGPCVEAYRTGEAVSMPDLRTEDRFPAFTLRAREAGMAAVFTFPLHHDNVRVGTLDLYRDTPGGLSIEALTAVQTLADVATSYLLNAQAREDLQVSNAEAWEASAHDALTGLPNRVLLLERLEHAFARGRRSGKTVAVLFVDLDSFKTINDTYGHQVGDEALVAVAGRLSALLRPGDTLARLHGDEFVIVCEDIESQSEERESPSEVIAHRVDTALAAPLVLSRTVVDITASVGIAFSSRDPANPERLIHDADMAMYQAKRAGGGHRPIFNQRDQPCRRQAKPRTSARSVRHRHRAIRRHRS